MNGSLWSLCESANTIVNKQVALFKSPLTIMPFALARRKQKSQMRRKNFIPLQLENIET
jgi:hypothetical protein